MDNQTNGKAARPVSLRSDPRGSAELLHIALTAQNENDQWQAIAALHLRGDQATFDAACQLCTSSHSHERCVGADILGQLGVPADTFREEAVTKLLSMLQAEEDPQVLNAVGVALGHRNDPRAIEPLIRLSQHPDENVRFGVVMGLTGYDDERAIKTLITLSQDQDVDIRNWSTFALGSMIDTDTPVIRAALHARLNDSDVDTHDEALLGLARRHDDDGLEPLRQALEETTNGGIRPLVIEAAEEFADPRLLLALKRLQANWPKDEHLDWLYSSLERAIEACM